MKKTLLIAIAFCLTGISNAQVTSGLVAKYSFNSGNANDEAGTNNGTIHGATLTNDRFGNAGHAFNFKALDSAKIVVSHNSSIDFNNSSEFTVAFWMKTSSSNGSHKCPFAKQLADGSWNGYSFITNGTDGGYCNGPGSFFFYTASGAMQDACADSLVSHDTTHWKFVTAIYKGTLNRSYLYIDGNLQADSGSISGLLSTTADLAFGGHPDVNTAFYSGKLDDIRIYNRALNSVEIDSLLNEPNPVSIGVIENQNDRNQVSVYPNPTNGLISLNGNYDVELTGISGEPILKAVNSRSLNITDLPNGIYFMLIRNKNNELIQTNKIIKN